MKRKSLVGKRVEFTGFRQPDVLSQLPHGMKGTVSIVDDAGTVHVDWDNGSQLGVFTGEYRVLSV